VISLALFVAHCACVPRTNPASDRRSNSQLPETSPSALSCAPSPGWPALAANHVTPALPTRQAAATRAHGEVARPSRAGCLKFRPALTALEQGIRAHQGVQQMKTATKQEADQGSQVFSA